jgi:hypothetical protein
MRPLKHAQLTVAMAFLLSSCANASDTRIVGNINDVISETAFLGGAPTADGDKIHARQTVSTNAEGRVSLAIDPEIERLDLLGDSEIRVVPEDGILLEVVRGTGVYLTAKSSAGPNRSILAPGVRITARDPAFWISVKGDRTEVGVIQGSVELRSDPDRGGPVVINQDELSSVTRGASPSPPKKWVLDDLPPDLKMVVLDFLQLGPG